MEAKMKARNLFVFFVVSLVLVGTAAADLSVQLKRTNPGIAGEKPAEIIFDVVNTDMTHKIEGFIWCRSPDDAVVSSSMGSGTGSGAQYVSPKFFMDSGPSQKAMSLVLEADTAGDKRTGCTVKYAPYKETTTSGTTVQQTTPISYAGLITNLSTDVSGFDVRLDSFVAAVEATNETVASPAKATVNVNSLKKEIEVGKSEKVSDLTVEVKEANAVNATVSVTGTKTVELTQPGEVGKQFLKMNGIYVSALEDGEYRELRLDKTVPFVAAEKAKPTDELACPEGKTSCTASEVKVVNVGGVGIPIWAIIAGVVVIVLLIVFLLGRTSKD